MEIKLSLQLSLVDMYIIIVWDGYIYIYIILSVSFVESMVIIGCDLTIFFTDVVERVVVIMFVRCR